MNNIVCFVLGVIFLILFGLSWLYGVNYNLLFIGLFIAGNAIVYDKNEYYAKTKAMNKDNSKTIEVKLFKVSNFETKTLLRHISPHYYSVFISNTPKGYRIKNEEEIFKQ